jgi:hypothetical protein
MNFDPGSTLIILLMVALIALFVYQRQLKNITNESFTMNKEDIYEKKYKKYKKYKTMKHDDAIKYLNKLNEKNKISKQQMIDALNELDTPNNEPVVNDEFIEMQYHKDYADTITAINNLTPQKELFNMGFLPVKQVTPNQKNINELVDLFMKKLNNEITTNVQEYLHTNSGWSDMGKRRREKSGFEEQMEELGLPGTMYNEPAAKACANLIRIDKSEQFNTEDQIRFIAYLIIQKPNVQDQMVLKVQFFLEREDLKAGGDHRERFFEKGLEDSTPITDQVVIIEQVFTLGYLTNQTQKKTKMDKFHDYSDIQRSDGTINQEKVIKMMLNKHKERADELKSFKATLGNEAQEIRGNNDGNDVLYENTRTIMDDLAQFPHKSFGKINI